MHRMDVLGLANDFPQVSRHDHDHLQVGLGSHYGAVLSLGKHEPHGPQHVPDLALRHELGVVQVHLGNRAVALGGVQ